AVLYDKAKGTVRVDVNDNGDFSDDEEMKPYKGPRPGGAQHSGISPLPARVEHAHLRTASPGTRSTR
ncbi:hypothetical protein ABZ769_29145, partial [Streptomyces olivoreticuli]